MRGLKAPKNFRNSALRITTSLLLTLLTVGLACAQNIQLTPRGTSGQTMVGLTAQFKMDVHNLTNTTQTIMLRHYAVSLPSSWTHSMCTGAACFPDFIDSISYDLPAFGFDSVALDIYPDVAGQGSAGLHVWQAASADSFRVVCSLIATNEAAHETVPNSYSISRIYPNPFNSNTKVRFSLPMSGKVRLTLYDRLGRTLAESGRQYSPGTNEISLINWFDGLSSGLYFIHIETPVEQRTHRVEYIR